MSNPHGTADSPLKSQTEASVSGQSTTGTEPSAPAPPQERLSEPDAMLLRAAHLGQQDLLATALSQGARIAVAEPGTGLTALHIAVGTNNLPLTRYLVEQCKAPFGPDRFGRWPTVVAAECYAGEELCDYIVEQEAKFTPPSK